MAQNKYHTLQKKITGPVYPLLPAFQEDESLDLDALRRYVEYLNSHHVRCMMMTAGTSRYHLLERDEILQLNQAFLEANQGKSISIAATPMTGSTRSMVDFIKRVEEYGADIVLILYPERYYGDGRVYAFYEQVAEHTNIAIMIHAMPMRNGLGEGVSLYSVDLCKRLAKIDNIIGMKEEHFNPGHRFQLGVNVGDSMNICVAGGAMKTFMSAFLFNINSYLGGVGSFKPPLEEEFYTAMVQKNFDRACEIMMRYEYPLFAKVGGIGWHTSMKAILSLMNLMPATERSPMQQPDETQIKVLQELIQEFGWI